MGQQCNEVVILWTSLSDSLSPITSYTITIDGSTVSVPGNESQYTHPVSDSECGSTVQISMSATSAAGTGENTTMDLSIVCTCECFTYCTICSGRLLKTFTYHVLCLYGVHVV